MMLFFIVFINVWAGIIASFHLISTSSGFLLVFPIWNFLNVFLLFFLFRFGILNEKAIQDENANFSEILFGSAVLMVIFYFSHYIYVNHWSITFSISVGYATGINEAVKNLIFNKQTIKS